MLNPDKPVPTARAGDKSDRTNDDFFANAKAQAWWDLRVRFQRTYRAITGEDANFDPDEIISICSGFPEHAALIAELSQPTYTINGAGKVLVDKAPEGAKSPNLADSAMIAFAPRKARRAGLFG